MIAADSRALRARIFDAFPVTQPAFARLLGLLDIEATDTVPTAAVTLGVQSRLLINPAFVETMCTTDHDLVMLVLHELFHVALGHTRLFPRLTPAQNWAFDCVINAQLCRLHPHPRWTALFRRCYSAALFPEALLRPPQGWRTPDVRWLPGRPGEIHRALYSDEAVSYTDLYALLPQLPTHAAEGGVLTERLLGDHSPAADGAQDSDLIRELRDIVAEWPLLEQRSGRDQGAEALASRVAAAERSRAIVAVIRRALLAIADLGRGTRGAVATQSDVTQSVLPYTTRPLRSDFVREALGSPVLLHSGWLETNTPVRREQVHVYLDVSGSMETCLPALYAALHPLSALLHPQVHLFSNVVHDVDLRALRRGVRVSTGGTDISPVTAHALKTGIQRALILTDGWVGKVPEEHARKLADRHTRFSVVLTAGGDPKFATRLAARTWQLPRLETRR